MKVGGEEEGEAIRWAFCRHLERGGQKEVKLEWSVVKKRKRIGVSSRCAEEKEGKRKKRKRFVWRRPRKCIPNGEMEMRKDGASYFESEQDDGWNDLIKIKPIVVFLKQEICVK